MPSRRRQSSRAVSRSAPAGANPGRTAAARRVKSSRASPSFIGVSGKASSPSTRRGRRPGGEDLEAGCPAQQLPYETGARVGEVLETVDHEQESASRAVLEQDGARRPAACGR